LARVLGRGECGWRGGLYGRVWHGQGAKDRTEIGEESVEIFQEHIVFVLVSLGGMTCGAIMSAAGGEGVVNGSGRRGKRAVGHLRPRAGFGPRGLLFFFLFLSIFFLFYFVKISKSTKKI
jgi:hypothetical protein